MKRLSIAGFAALVLATIGAFFLTAVLKKKNPVVFGQLQPVPAAFNPVSGRVCTSRSDQPLNYRQTQIAVRPSHTDSVGVYVISARNASGAPVATVTAGTQMNAGQLRLFTWNGRLSTGALAPAGRYYFRIVLNHEDRSVELRDAPVQVIRSFLPPRVLSARVTGGSGARRGGVRVAGTATLTPPRDQATIHFTPGVYRRIWIDVYRTRVGASPRKVEQFPSNPALDTTTWNGRIHGVPAPPGTYLIGITAQDAACDQAQWPATLPPSAGSTAGAGVSVGYVSLEPPLGPTRDGSRASVAVDSPLGRFSWTLRRTGTRRVLKRGSGPAGTSRLRVRLPTGDAGLYTLSVRARGHGASVPLVAYAGGRAGAHARVLVVLPMLTWVGESAVDDNGDGLPDTLGAGDGVSLERPLIYGGTSAPNATPAGQRRLIADDAALLRYLNAHHRRYQLTTDLALAHGVGPSLVDRWGVLLPDGSQYLPSGLRTLLLGFVKGGGRALVLGTDSLLGTSQVRGFPAKARAAAPVRNPTDLFGAQHGPLSSTDGALIVGLVNQLKLFGEIGALGGFSEYQPLEPPAGAPVSALGIAARSAAVIAFPVGRGKVVEVGLPNFGSSLAGDASSQELLREIWPLLAKQR